MSANIIFSISNISKNIIRSYARRAKISNPGIQKRLNIVKDGESNFEDIDVDDYESDFMNLKEIHKNHEKELKYYKEKEKFWIVKQKYFKENKINFLNWNDKEQIRHLHQSNPEEWTVEKLSEGFPALPDTINKILKNKWQVKNESKIRNHDLAVEQNWKNLKTGKLSDILPPNLINHLNKFTARKAQKFEIKNLPKPVDESDYSNKEFSSIISNYEKVKIPEKTKMETKFDEYCERTNKIEDKLKSFGNKPVTLNIIKGDSTDKPIKNNSEPNLLENLFKNDNSVPEKFIKQKNNISTTLKEDKNSNLIAYPEKIQIPKEAYKKGFTYKVNDCYYDDDGEFLYRVPGMY